MTGEPQGDGYTLGLLVDLRALCTKIGDSHYRMAAELHDLLRQVANASELTPVIRDVLNS